MAYNFILENILFFDFFQFFGISLQMRVNLQIAFNSGVGLCIFIDHHDWFSAVRAIFRTIHPIGKAPSAIRVQAWYK